MVPPEHKPTALESIDRYTIERLLGSGAMGSVYLAYDTRLRRRVALKILGGGATALGVDMIAVTMREARAAGAIAHPNATAVFDADESNGAAYIVMEYVPGTPLRRFVGDSSVPMSLRVRWLVDIAGALAAAHAVGVIHRDMKPDNVMIRDDGMVKVLDFGIARISDAAEEGLRAAVGGHVTWTQEGTFVGTPGYIAPEIIRGQPADGRADQFSWGVLAYELLTGRLPWRRADASFAVIASVLTQQPDPIGPDVPPVVAAVVSRALAKMPEERFPSLGHAAFLLADFAETGGVALRIPLDPPSRPVTMGGDPPYPPARPAAPAPSSRGAPLPVESGVSVPRVPWGTLSSGVAPPELSRATPVISPRDPPSSPPYSRPVESAISRTTRPLSGARADDAPAGRRTPVFPVRSPMDPRVEETQAPPTARSTPVVPPRRSFDVRADEPPPSPRAARRTSPRPVHDPRVEEGPPPSAPARHALPAPPPRRQQDSRPDEAPGSARRPPPRRAFDARSDDPPTPPPRRAFDSRSDDPPTPPPRRAFDARSDDPPTPPPTLGAARRTPAIRALETRPDDAPMPSPPRRPPPPGFRAPDFHAPVDVQGNIALLPPDATCKGMFFHDLFDLASKMHSPDDLALLAGIPDRRYVAFRDYPMRDAMRLTVAAAATVYPRLPLGEALRRIGQRALSLVLDSHIGRTLFGVLPRDAEPYLLNGPKAYRMLIGFGQVTAEKIAPRTFRLSARDMPLFLETYHVGLLESVLAHCNARGLIEIETEGLAHATISLRLR